jgi:uncharacterized membrane protein
MKKKRTTRQSGPGKGSAGKLNKIMALEKSILEKEDLAEKRENAIADGEKKLEEMERAIEDTGKRSLEEEKKEESDIEKLERLQREIKSDVEQHPLTKITPRDFIKGLVGAFVGLSVHYTFTYGVKITEHMTTARATMLLVVSFIVGIVFIYATGFRKIQDKKVLAFMPIRAIVLYFTSIVTCIVVLFIFYPDFGLELIKSYKMVSGVSLAAMIGACTADLIGKE